MNTAQQKKFDALYRQHLSALRRQGKAASTIDAYARAVRRVTEYWNKCPDTLTLGELETYFNDLVQTHSWSTVKVDRNGLQFFYTHVLKRDWDWVAIVKPPRETTQPDLLTRTEIETLINSTRELRYQTFILAAYSMGLRLSEVLSLQIKDIDSARMKVHVRRDKGKKDRFVFLPTLTLQALRRQRASHRNPSWLFPAGQSAEERTVATGRQSGGSQQKAFTAILHGCGIHKAATPHTLRLCYGAHLVEAGLKLRAIQHQMVPRESQNHRPLYPAHGAYPDRCRFPHQYAGGRSTGGNDMDLASLCQQYLPRLQQIHGHNITAEQWRALRAITGCRTGHCGDLLLQCADCRQLTARPRSCGHRGCNRCQQQCSQDWLARQSRKLLPVPYVLVTFTLPEELRPLARQHGRVVYDRLMQCAASTLQRFGRNANAGDTALGLCAVLHMRTRRQDYHPHVHVVVPAGGVGRSKRLWRRLGNDYLFNGRALAAAFRGAMLNALATVGFAIPVAPKRWIVHCKKVGRGRRALQYLSRYLYRGVVSNHQLVADDGNHVTFRYKDSKTGERKTRTLPGEDFLWLVLQHVLPKGFRRAVDYGFTQSAAFHCAIGAAGAATTDTSEDPRSAHMCDMPGPDARHGRPACDSG